jgi:hypothetical protein
MYSRHVQQLYCSEGEQLTWLPGDRGPVQVPILFGHWVRGPKALGAVEPSGGLVRNRFSEPVLQLRGGSEPV